MSTAPAPQQATKSHRGAKLVLLASLALVACSGGHRAAAPTGPPPGVTLVASATSDQVAIFAAPNAPSPSTTLPNPWFVNGDPSDPVPQVFLVVAQRRDGWVQVLLPGRPNGSVGWVRSDAVQLLGDPYHIIVRLSARTIQVWRGVTVLYQGPVAVGAPATPTPTGDYYIRVLLRSRNAASLYGPYAYGLSAHSDALSTFDGGDAEIGIHGNDDASALGRSVTHGCVRIDNGEISVLASLLPLGTPVHVEA